MRKAITLFYIVFLQPPALITWAGVIIGFYVTFELLGWREFTTVLSGTFPTELSSADAASRSTIYLVSYFAAILLAPIMILAAMLGLAGSFMRTFIGRRFSSRP